MKWLDSEFTVEMPDLLPGQLSEVEMLKRLGVHQWRAIASMLGVPAQDIVNDQGERLYGSFINFEASLGNKTFRNFTEGDRIYVRHAAHLYAKRFVEGVLFFDDSEIPDAALPDGIGPEALANCEVPHFYATNAFVAREVSNLRLRTFAPSGDPPGADATIDEMPFGIRDHEVVHRTGAIEFPGLESATPLPGMANVPILYQILPESDMNGAGLVYFARYVAMMNYGERRILQECGPVPVSAPLVTYLSTERRRIFFFANANANDQVRVQSSVYATAVDPDEPSADPTIQVALRVYFVTNLFRASDGVLMAKSVVRKALCLPRRAKRLMYEANRLALLWELG